jgi:hypothetical protein
MRHGGKQALRFWTLLLPMAADCSYEKRQNRDVTTQARARARETSRDEEEKEKKEGASRNGE